MQLIQYLKDKGFDFTTLPVEVQAIAADALQFDYGTEDLQAFNSIAALMPAHKLVVEAKGLLQNEIANTNNDGFNTVVDDVDLVDDHFVKQLEFINNKRTKIKIDGIEFTLISDAENNIHIDRIEGKGLMNALEKLTSAADILQKSLSTNILPDDPTDGNYEALRRIYEEYGFEPLEMDGEIYRNDLSRQPQKVKSFAAGGQVNKNKLLAPNGQLSNLSADQWNVVRTPAFKTWFGDWEIAFWNPPTDIANYLPRSVWEDTFVKGRVGLNQDRPWNGKIPPVGTWLIDDMVLMYGREISVLIEMPLSSLTGTELNNEGQVEGSKQQYVDTYAKWINNDESPAPPISLVQTDKGRFRIIDGHRRYVAAKKAGKSTILCWLSPSMDNPLGKLDSNGKILRTGLTYETAVKKLSESCSKVVDENGEPLVVYHNGRAGINIFYDKPQQRKTLVGVNDFYGIYFSPSVKIATLHVHNGNTIYKCFVNLRNPYEAEGQLPARFSEPKDRNITSRLVIGSAAITQDEFDYLTAKKAGGTRQPKLLIPHDGVIYRERDKQWNPTKTIFELAVFYPNQIKLADGSNTTFNADTPDIRFAAGGSVYATRVSDNMEHMGTQSTEWTAVPVIGFQETEVNGRIRKMPLFDFPKGYSKAPSLYPMNSSGTYNCELCSKDNIKTVYHVKHDKNKWLLSVGSECVTHFAEGKSGKQNVREFKIQTAKILDADLLKFRKLIHANFSRVVDIGYGRKERQWNSWYVGAEFNKQFAETNEAIKQLNPVLLFDKGKIADNIKWKYVYDHTPMFGYEQSVAYQKQISKEPDLSKVEKDLLSWFTRNEKNASDFLQQLIGVFNLLKSNLPADFDLTSDYLDSLNKTAETDQSFAAGGEVDMENFDWDAFYAQANEPLPPDPAIELNKEQITQLQLQIDNKINEKLAAIDSWQGRKYKRNSDVVYKGGDDIHGEAMSISGINEARRRKKIQGFQLQVEALQQAKEILTNYDPQREGDLLTNIKNDFRQEDYLRRGKKMSTQQQMRLDDAYAEIITILKTGSKTFAEGGQVDNESQLYLGDFSLIDREDSIPIDWIAVPKDERRSGMATKLIIEQMQELKKQGIQYIEVATTPDGTKLFSALEKSGILINVPVETLTQDKEILKNSKDLDLHVYKLAKKYLAAGGSLSNNNTMATKTVTENQLENSSAGGALVGKRRQGHDIIHNDGTMGGYLTGKLHREGGIKATIKGGGQQIEMQGGEVVITAPAVDDKKKREFNGKMMTNREILSAINESGGGVSFAKGGDVPSGIKCSGKKYTYGGKVMTDKDIVSGCGCKHSMEEGGEVNNEIQFIDYKGQEIMFEPIEKEYFVGDHQFTSIDDAKKYIDKGSPLSAKEINLYRHGAMAAGGPVLRTTPLLLAVYKTSEDFNKGTNPQFVTFKFNASTNENKPGLTTKKENAYTFDDLQELEEAEARLDEMEFFEDLYQLPVYFDNLKSIYYVPKHTDTDYDLYKPFLDQQDAAWKAALKTGNYAAGGAVSDPNGKILIPVSIVEQIKESISLGFNQVKVGMISPKRKGILLVNEDYKVRGTYPLEMKHAVEKLISENSFAAGGAVSENMEAYQEERLKYYEKAGIGAKSLKYQREQEVNANGATFEFKTAEINGVPYNFIKRYADGWGGKRGPDFQITDGYGYNVSGFFNKQKNQNIGIDFKVKNLKELIYKFKTIAEDKDYIIRDGFYNDKIGNSFAAGGAVSDTTIAELDKAKKELESGQKLQDRMKAANKIIAGKKDVNKRLAELGISESEIAKITKGDFMGRIGYASYKLTNNNANNRRLQDRVAILEQKVKNAQKAADTEGGEQYTFEVSDGGRIDINYGEDRVQIFFKRTSKPDPEIYEKLKRNGWHWSYTNKAWQRKITPQAISNAVYITGAKKVGATVLTNLTKDSHAVIPIQAIKHTSYRDFYIVPGNSVPNGKYYAITTREGNVMADADTETLAKDWIDEQYENKTTPAESKIDEKLESISFADVKQGDHVRVTGYSTQTSKQEILAEGIVTFKYGRHYLNIDDQKEKYNYGNTYYLLPKTEMKSEVDKPKGRLKLSDIPAVVKAFMPEDQQKAIVGSEEHWEVIERLQNIITEMPKTYGTEKIEEDEKICYLRYFFGDSEWYIIEKDMYASQEQAFGWAILNGDYEMAELGYISIEELKTVRYSKPPYTGVELDFYFTPTKLGDIKKKLGYGDEEEEKKPLPKFKPGDKVKANAAGIKHEPAMQRFNEATITELTNSYEVGKGYMYDTVISQDLSPRFFWENEIELISSGKIQPKTICLDGSIFPKDYEEANRIVREMIDKGKMSNCTYDITFTDGELLQGSIDLEPRSFWKDNDHPFTWHINTFWGNLAAKGSQYAHIPKLDIVFAQVIVSGKYDLGNPNKGIFGTFAGNVSQETMNAAFIPNMPVKPGGYTDKEIDDWRILHGHEPIHSKPVSIISEEISYPNQTEEDENDMDENYDAEKGRKLMLIWGANEESMKQQFDIYSALLNGENGKLSIQFNKRYGSLDLMRNAEIHSYTGNAYEDLQEIRRYLLKLLDIFPFELTPEQQKALYKLTLQPESFVLVDYNYFTQHLRALEFKSLIMGTNNPKDQHNIEVRLTENGKKFLRPALFAPENRFTGLLAVKAADPVTSYTVFKGFDFKYKNAYDLNKAIEDYIDNTPANMITDEGKSFISYYSGYGGLEKYGADGKGLMYEFFTPTEICKRMWGLAYKYGYSGGPLLEPAVGVGEFLKYAPDGTHCTTFEINEYSHKICRILYPNGTHHLKSFETLFIKNNRSIKDKIEGLEKYDLVISNPPYGMWNSLYKGMGEGDYTKAENWVEYFIFRSLDLLNKNGLLIFIIGTEVATGGTPWLQKGMTKCKAMIAEKADLLDAYRLPNGVFDRTDVLSDIIVLRKK